MSLDSLVNAAAGNDLKFVFVGGKGGVGKTTSSSAIATLLATWCRKRVLLISTDPAHSLGDAWRTSFSNTPQRVPLADDSACLEVMEVDPQASLKGELHQWAAVSQELLATEEGSAPSTQTDEWSTRIHQFQEWLSGIPGIDEATALSTAITHIESGKYDLIVFDTAPTGHTLKLLALPEILEAGIDKLQSWQTTFWGYWEAFKAAKGGEFSKAQQRAHLKEQVKDKLVHYKRDIQKVALMLQDQTRTRFVVVCIAEFLSVSETQRLLQELRQHKVVASHIVVNQLVVQEALSSQELTELESLAEVGNLQLPAALLQKTVHACRLTTARKNIQQRYLSELKGYPETQSILEGIAEVPLLAEEVTGPDAIQRFAKLLIQEPTVSMQLEDASANHSSGGKLYDHLITAPKNNGTAPTDDDDDETLAPGDLVQVMGLAKAPQYNGLNGKVTSPLDPNTGRYGVTLAVPTGNQKKKSKTLALQPKNIQLLSKEQQQPTDNNNNNNSSNPLMAKAKTLLEDPEIKAMVETNPRLKAAVEDCLASPTNVLKYLSDPELSPYVAKIMAKL